MPFGTKEFMKLMNLAIWYYRFPVRFIQFHQVVNEEFLDPEFPNLKRPDPGVPETKFVFFNEKGSKGKKGTFTRYVEF